VSAGSQGVAGRAIHPRAAPTSEAGGLQAELLREREGEGEGVAPGWEWPRVEAQAEVAREVAWEALHGGPWRGVPMDWRDAHALSCWLLAFAQVHPQGTRRVHHSGPMHACAC